MIHSTRTKLGALLMASALALTGCTAETEDAAGTGDTPSVTVAQALSTQADLSTLSQAVVDAQLNEVLDGSGSYTVFAPTDAAFSALGEDGRQLLTLEQRPLLVGLLREHIVPGHLTPTAIGRAIEDAASNGGGPVTTATMGGGALTFARDGEVITVSRGDGEAVRLVGEATESGNGVVIPVDAVLTPAAGTGDASAAQ